MPGCLNQRRDGGVLHARKRELDIDPQKLPKTHVDGQHAPSRGQCRDLLQHAAIGDELGEGTQGGRRTVRVKQQELQIVGSRHRTRFAGGSSRGPQSLAGLVAGSREERLESGFVGGLGEAIEAFRDGRQPGDIHRLQLVARSQALAGIRSE
jgi:hypothetical protein